MKPTGRFFPSFHPNAGEEIMQIEEQDISFWDKEWSELSTSEKADYCSFKGIGYLNSENEELVKTFYYSDVMKLKGI